MDLDREKALKIVIVILATLAALAVMSTLVQLIQTVLPFLIVGAGVYAAYRWALSDSPAPTADEVEEQARGLFGRFRRGKQAVEATMQAADSTMKVAETLNEFSPKPETKPHRRRRTRAAGSARAPAAKTASVARDAGKSTAERDQKIARVKQSLDSNPKGAIEFKDRDVLISADDLAAPDISRLEEKEKEEPKVTNNVLAQIEERRRRLQGGA